MRWSRRSIAFAARSSASWCSTNRRARRSWPSAPVYASRSSAAGTERHDLPGRHGMTIWDRIRHPKAASVGEGAPLTTGFEALDGKYALLVTFRRNGRAIPTPIWFGLNGENLYVRTEADSAKVKRIRRNADVLVAPC